MTGDQIISAVIKTGAIQDAHKEGDSFIVVWRANAAEQIEAAMPQPAEHLCIACGKAHFGCCGQCEHYKPLISRKDSPQVEQITPPTP